MRAQPVQPACTRLFEVEALRDGRLTGAELARFQSHVRTCSACAQEVQAMTELADALRATAPSRDTDQLHVRRERTRLLAAFDASLVPAPSSSHAKRWLGAAAALVAAALLALLLRPTRPAAPSAASIDSVKVHAATTTKWSRRAENQLETITLESGTLSIRVDHQLPHRRLLVLLPDGELEDIGTTFSVTAAAARTTQVAVQDGSVILRLHDLPALTLRAGDSWTPTPTPATTTPAPTQPPAPPARSVRLTPVAAPAQSTTASHTADAPSASDSVNRPDPAADFRGAMSAFTGGDNARASALFAQFLNAYPRDSRAEDAAYLRVLALQRAGSSADMQQAAAEYLKRYPRGFRRAEVEPLSR
jgi:hypothetical protein